MGGCLSRDEWVVVGVVLCSVELGIVGDVLC